MQQKGVGGSWEEKAFLLSPGKGEGGGHVDISLHLEPTMDIWDKTGAKVDTLFLPATFYRHRTKHKEVVACSTNNGQLGGTTHPVKKYNVNSSHYYLIANYWILP